MWLHVCEGVQWRNAEYNDIRVTNRDEPSIEFRITECDFPKQNVYRVFHEQRREVFACPAIVETKRTSARVNFVNAFLFKLRSYRKYRCVS